jgi:hypothetical protein
MGSFDVLSGAIGEITLKNNTFEYNRKWLDMESWAQTHASHNKNLVHYQQYMNNLFYKDGENMAGMSMINEGWSDPKLTGPVGEFMGKLNIEYFSGEKISNELLNSKGYKLIEARPDSSFLKKYVNSIIDENENIPNTKLKIKISE